MNPIQQALQTLVKPVSQGLDNTANFVTNDIAKPVNNFLGAIPGLNSFLQQAAASENPRGVKAYAQTTPVPSQQTATPTPSMTPQQMQKFLSNWQTVTPSQQAVKGAATQIATPTPSPQSSPLSQQILQGFQNYGAPAATQSAVFAQAGDYLQKNYPKVDPLLPAVLSLKETSGGKNMAPNSANNLLNIGPNINYPSIQANVMGGGTWGINGSPQQGFMGILTSGKYDKYLKSGDLKDFFKVYTPTYDNNGKKVNGTLDEQIKQYNTLRKTFVNTN